MFGKARICFRKSMVRNMGSAKFLFSENFGLYSNLLFSVYTYQQTTVHFLHTALPLAHSRGGIISHAGNMICANNTSLSCDKPVCDTCCLSYLSHVLLGDLKFQIGYCNFPTIDKDHKIK